MGVINWNEKNPPNESGAELEPSSGGQDVLVDTGKAEAEVAKLASDLEELRHSQRIANPSTPIIRKASS